MRRLPNLLFRAGRKDGAGEIRKGGSDRDLVLTFVLLGLLVLGLVFDVLAGEPAEEVTTESSGDRFAARSLFCPPGAGGKARVGIAAAPGVAMPVGIETAGKPERRELAADRLITLLVPDEGALDVVGYGAPAFATAALGFEGPVSGLGAVPCAATASGVWHFAEGQSTLGYDDRLVVYNPFPDEAVVRVSFPTPSGTKSKAGLTDVAVPAGKVITVKANDFILRQRVLGATVTARRGRVVAWRIQFAEPETRPRAVVASLGSTRPATTWYFPDGAAGRGITERISIVNPSDEEAAVTVALATSDRSIQPPELVEVPLPAGSADAISLPNLLQGKDARAGGLSAIVRSTNGVPIVAERTVWYDTPALRGAASEMGSTRVAATWALGPALFDPTNDAVALMNPGSEPVAFSVTFVRAEGRPYAPKQLTDLELKPGARVKLPIGEWTSGKAILALVSADGGVVAERFAYSATRRDVAAVMGLPLTPTGR